MAATLIQSQESHIIYTDLISSFEYASFPAQFSYRLTRYWPSSPSRWSGSLLLFSGTQMEVDICVSNRLGILLELFTYEHQTSTRQMLRRWELLVSFCQALVNAFWGQWNIFTVCQTWLLKNYIRLAIKIHLIHWAAFLSRSVLKWWQIVFLSTSYINLIAPS